MAYNRSPLPRQSSSTLKNELVLAIGGNAYINLPQTPTRPQKQVPIRDAQGQPVENDLSDGEQVEILAWQPGAREGLAYQIRRVADGQEWWLLSRYLRKSAEPVVESGDAT